MEKYNYLYKKEELGNGVAVNNTAAGFSLIKDGREIRFIKAKPDAPYCIFRLSIDGKRLYYHRIVDLFPGKAGEPSPPSYIVPEELSIDGDGIEFDSSGLGRWHAVAETTLSFFYSIDDSKRMNVAMEYFKLRDNYDVIPNEFEDDTTINVVVKTSIDNTVECDFLRFLMEPRSLQIYGIPADVILHVITKSSIYQSAKISLYPSQFNDAMDKACINIFAALKEKHGISDNETAQYIYDNYVIHDWEKRECILKYLRVHERHAFESNSKYDTLYAKIIDEGKYTPKWKSEFELYKLVKTYFSDAVYQYHAGFLGHQSLDIFIPSLNTGIEYQGKQHFEPIDFFGGTESFENVKKRDAEKREKCKKEGIRLIEWKYEEPISKMVLEKKCLCKNRKCIITL